MRAAAQLIILVMLMTFGYTWASANAYNDIELDRRLSFLEEQMGRINGKLEEISHNLRSLQTNKITPTMPAQPGLMPVSLDPMATTPVLPSLSNDTKPYPVVDSVVEKNTLPTGDAQKDYELAIAHLHKGNYKQAERTLNAFIKKYPHNALNVNAKYWLGETYLIQSRFADAAIMFGEVYQIFHQQSQDDAPKNKIKQSRAKAPEALIKLVFALKGMKKDQDACATLAQLSQEFPQLPQNLVKLTEKARLGLKCH